MYSITRGILRDLPVDHPEQLMHVAMTDRNAGDEYLRIPAADIVALREQQRSFEAIAAYDFESIHLGDADHRAQRLSAGRVNASLFAVLRVAPLLGRALTSDDERPGAPRVAILGYQLWQNRYAGDRSVVGRTIRVNGVPTTVVGVMPNGFGFPLQEQLWTPLAARRTPRETRRSGWPRLQRHRSPAERRHTRDGGRRHREHRASTRDRGSEGARRANTRRPPVLRRNDPAQRRA